jgi:hypothetical protein
VNWKLPVTSPQAKTEQPLLQVDIIPHHSGCFADAQRKSHAQQEHALKWLTAD